MSVHWWKKILKWIGHFLLKEKRKNDKKSNHHSENSVHIKSIHWVVFDMSMYILSFSPFFFFSSSSLSSLSIEFGSWHFKKKASLFSLVRMKRKKVNTKWKYNLRPKIFFYKVFWCMPPTSSSSSFFFYSGKMPRQKL